MAGIQYLDELFSAIRSTAEQLAIADTWLSKAEESPRGPWRMSFLDAARGAQSAARRSFDEANGKLTELGPASRLPSLLAAMPERLAELRTRLEASEKRLALALDADLQAPRGQA